MNRVGLSWFMLAIQTIRGAVLCCSGRWNITRGLAEPSATVFENLIDLTKNQGAAKGDPGPGVQHTPMPFVQVHVSSTVGQAISALENKLMNADVALRHADGSRLVNAVKRMARRQSGRGQYSQVRYLAHLSYTTGLRNRRG
jgi:hypothetical protein